MAEDDSKGASSMSKLSSTNYSTWKGEMKAFLRTRGLWSIVCGTEKCPEDAKHHL